MTPEKAKAKLEKLGSKVWLLPSERKAIELAVEYLGRGTCANCKYGLSAGRLVGCLNTEFNLTSCQNADFYCKKWEKSDDVNNGL